MTSKHNGYLDMQLLRFTTAGSVDDGKSTLIGRLLYDSKAIFEDQLKAIERASVGRGEESVNLALLTDGLRAEREQGITIDVAYRYFATPKRKFIIADTPGHIQYTRNMVTGASTANMALILVDARNGVLEQTIRHAYIASLLRIPHVVLCVNKMDLVNYEQATFNHIVKHFTDVASKLDIKDVRFVPISARHGDNVVERSGNMPWYDGTTLMFLLENIYIGSDYNHECLRFPVQYVIRPMSDKYHDFRVYAGRIASGIVRPGDSVNVLPSGMKTRIRDIYFFDQKQDVAFAPQSVTLTLEDDIDISRGDMIVCENREIMCCQDFDMMICWLNIKPMQLNGRYILRHTTREVKCVVKEVKYKVNIHTLEKDTSDSSIGLNDIGRIRVKTSKSVYCDPYSHNRVTGSVTLIDEGTNVTVCAGMIV